MVNPIVSQSKRKAILPIQAVISASVSHPPGRASLPEVKKRLRDEAHLVKPKENEQTLGYATTKGHGILDKLSVISKEVEESRRERAEHKTILDRHEHQIEKQRTTIDFHESQLEELGAKVRHLTETSEGYLDLRTRFLDDYQRHRGNLTELQDKEIKKRNWRARSGDAAVDAKLYREAGRADGEVFQELYGVQFEQVLNLVDEIDEGRVDGKVLLVLDIHGAQVASGARFPMELEAAFDSYLSEEFKESEDIASYKSSQQVTTYESANNLVARARDFWNLHEKFKKSTQGKGTSSSKLD